MIDPTINIGNIIQILMLLIGGLGAVITLRSSVGTLKTDVTDIQAEIKKLADLVTKMAVTDLRLTNLEQDIRDLRRGEGWITAKRKSVDGEYK